MKWEQYKQLTVEQKEEYNFKFKHNKVYFDISGVAMWCTIFVLLFMVNLFEYYIITVDDRFVKLQHLLPTILKGITLWTECIFFSLIFFALFGGSEIFWNLRKERKWLKQNCLLK